MEHGLREFERLERNLRFLEEKLRLCHVVDHSLVSRIAQISALKS